MDILARLISRFNEHIPFIKKKRRCRYKGCKTILSRYDRRRYCYLHHQVLWEAKPKHYLPINKELEYRHRRRIAKSIKEWWRKRKSGI